MDDGPEVDYYENRELFLESFYSEEYKKDTLLVSSIMKVNCCSELVARIEFSQDTLFLGLVDIGDAAGSCEEFRFYSYRIYNPKNKEYFIRLPE